MSVRLSVRSATLALTAGALAVTGAVVVGAPASAGDNRTTVLRTVLNGANEAPAPGDPDGAGRAKVRVKASTGQICISATVTGIALPAVGAHIHEKNPGTNTGPVVVNFTPPGSDGVMDQCVLAPTVVDGLVEDPSEYYVNVHTTEFRGGAIRGDLG